ncbi:sulfhydryl oxidase [Favolaschia claudopus]|uniref:Sulfhydryl oxidase n=1 Tax=Favolaschia claudopus TaxID=2862362 RepID=A0AAW0BEK9_9AGAR
MPLLPFVLRKHSSERNLRHEGPQKPRASRPTVPLPRTITEQLSTELYELILDHLDDTPTLLTCNRVCRSWAPRSKCLLLGRAVCRPLPIVSHGSLGAVTCAIPNPTAENNGIIFGTREGVYRGTRHTSPQTRLLSLNDVTQIEAFPNEDFFVCLAGGTLMTMSLAALNSGTLRDSDITRVSQHVSFFSVHWNNAEGANHRLCALKTSSLSTTMKIYDLNAINHSTNLVIYRELYIPIETHSLRFINATRVGVAVKKGGRVKGGFEVVDFNTTESQGLLDPDDPSHPGNEVKKSKSKPMNFFKAGSEYLVCYDKLGFFVDRQGRMVRGDRMMKWSQTASIFVLREPYLLVFCSTFIEVWNISTGEKVQKIMGSYALLNSPNAGESILVLSLSSGDVSEMLFRDEPTLDV